MEKPAAAAEILFDRIERSRAASIMMMLRGLLSIDLKQGNSLQVMQENIIVLRASIIDLRMYVE